MLLAGMLVPVRVNAQLRPLEPLDWNGFSAARTMRASMQVSYLHDQRASLAGVRGNLFEVGEARFVMRSGRVQLEAAGTLQRFLRDEDVLEEPAGDARAASAERKRHDSGDYRIGTAIAIGDLTGSTLGAVRFGTRLPTTDNRVGLDRDATDFFGTIGLQHRWQRLSVSGSAGVGINGTRITTYEQSDVLAYDVSMRWSGGGYSPVITLVGQNDLRSGRIRGNEDLMELRGGIRIGDERWLDVAVVGGLTEFSPGVGVIVGGGLQFGTVR